MPAGVGGAKGWWHGSRIGACLTGEARVGVPQVMDAVVRQAGMAESLGERAVDLA